MGEKRMDDGNSSREKERGGGPSLTRETRGGEGDKAHLTVVAELLRVRERVAAFPDGGRRALGDSGRLVPEDICPSNQSRAGGRKGRTSHLEGGDYAKDIVGVDVLLAVERVRKRG